MRKASEFETMVINYLITQALEGNQWNKIDKSFIKYPSIKGSLPHWGVVYGTIYHQVRLNPDDVNGYSITPKWVRDVYIEYKKSSKHRIWKPNEYHLESLYEEVNQEANTKTSSDLIGWSARGDNRTINILDIDGTPDFKRGYLKAMGAYKLYRIKKEEISFDAL